MIKPLTTTFSIGGTGLMALKRIQKGYESLKASFQTVESGAKNSFAKMGTYANGFFAKMRAGVVRVGTGFKTMFARSALGFKNFFGGALGKIGLVAGTLGVGMGLGSAISEYKAFDDVMLQNKAISKATEEQYISLRNQAKELGRTTRFTAEQVGMAQKFQAVAGWEVNDILKATPAIMNLAAASGEDLATVSDILTDSMTAFKWSAKDAAKFTDILAATATSTNTDVSKMGESFKYVSPMASALGESVESTAKYLGILANNALKGSMGGVALNQVFSNLLNPTKEVKELIRGMGIDLVNANGDFVGLDSTVEQFRKGLSKFSSFEKAEILNKIFGERGGRAMLTILKTGQIEIDKLTGAIKNSAGETDRMSKIMNGQFGGALDRLKSSASGLKIELMEVMAKPLADWFDKSSSKMDSWASKIKPLSEDLAKFWSDNKQAIIGIATVIGMMINPIATVATWFIALYNNCDQFREIVDFTFKHLFGFLIYSVEKIQDLIEWVSNLGREFEETFSFFKAPGGGFKTSLEEDNGSGVSNMVNNSTSQVKTMNTSNNNVVINVNGGDPVVLKKTIEEVMFRKELAEGRR